MTSIQLAIYALASNAAMGVSVYNALDTRTTFLSAGIFLSGGFNLIIVGNWLLSWFIILVLIIQRLFFGRLRFIEIQHIQERFAPKFFSFIMSFGYAREEYAFILVSLTVVSSVLNVCHWVIFDRLESLLQVNDETQLQDLKKCVLNRTTLTAMILCFIDLKFILFSIKTSKSSDNDVSALFGFDAALLLLECLYRICKEGINIAELICIRKNQGAEFVQNKSFYIRSLELAFLISKSVVYAFLLVYFSFPTQILFDFILGILAVSKKIKELIKFIGNAKRLNKVLQDATEEDLERSDRLCIICREDMSIEEVAPGSKQYPKKLNCDHIIHLGCLESWIEVSENCPICRANVFQSQNSVTIVATSQVAQNEPRIFEANRNNENNNGLGRTLSSAEPNGNVNRNDRENRIENYRNADDYFEDIRNSKNIENKNLKNTTENSDPNFSSTSSSGWKAFPIETISKNCYSIDINGKKGKIKIKKQAQPSSNMKRKESVRKIDEPSVLKLAERLDKFEKKMDELDKKLDLIISLSRLPEKSVSNETRSNDAD